MTRGRIAAVLLAAGLIAGATLSSAPRAHAATTSPHLVAFRWAKTQAGKPYIYGGTGPKGYDCSGLVYAAYKRAGFTLPRTTEGMLTSSKLGHSGKPKAGELAEGSRNGYRVIEGGVCYHKIGPGECHRR